MHNKYPYKTRNFGQPVPRWQLRNKLGSEHTKCCIKSGEMMLYHFIYFDNIYGFFLTVTCIISCNFVLSMCILQQSIFLITSTGCPKFRFSSNYRVNSFDFFSS